MGLSVRIGAKNQLPEVEHVFVVFLFFFLKLNKTTNILFLYFFLLFFIFFIFFYFIFFLLMENLGAMAYSRYTGFRKITDRNVLELHCIGQGHGSRYLLIQYIKEKHNARYGGCRPYS